MRQSRQFIEEAENKKMEELPVKATNGHRRDDDAAALGAYLAGLNIDEKELESVTFEDTEETFEDAELESITFEDTEVEEILAEKEIPVTDGPEEVSTEKEITDNAGVEEILAEEEIVEKGGDGETLVEKEIEVIDGSEEGVLSVEEKAITENPNPNPSPRDDVDAEFKREQVAWLKRELAKALAEQETAVRRVQELETAILEFETQDSSQELQPKLERLERQKAELSQLVAAKEEQEKHLLNVLMSMQHQQKDAEDARRKFELDSAAQRRAAQDYQEKYEKTILAIPEMEKRAKMAESMLEATLQSQQALRIANPLNSGSPASSLRRTQTDSAIIPPSGISPSTTLKDTASLPSGHIPQDSIKLLDIDDMANKGGRSSRPVGLSWRDRALSRWSSMGSNSSREDSPL